MLIEQIKNDQIEARKARDTFKATTLTTLYSEAAMVGKNDGNRTTNDSEVIAVVKKFLKGIEESIAAYPGEANELLAEKQILTTYLPSQFSDEKLSDIIDCIIVANNITEMKQMGLVMKELKSQFDGQFDGKTASSLVRSKLA